MALTMTRTRTQTALTKLVTLIAELHGELAVLESFCREQPGRLLMASARLEALRQNRDAVYAALRQFDPTLSPESIAQSHRWLKAHGRGKRALENYLTQYSRDV